MRLPLTTINMPAEKFSMTTKEMHSLVESWDLPHEQEDKFYSVNTVVDAYFRGLSDGKEQTNKVLKNQLQANLKKAAVDTSTVLHFLKDKKFGAISAHLKVCSLYDLSVIITVRDEDILSPGFTEAYDFTCNLEKKEKTDLYSISFSFVNKSPNFNSGLLLSDGYIFSHKEPGSSEKK